MRGRGTALAVDEVPTQAPDFVVPLSIASDSDLTANLSPALRAGAGEGRMSVGSRCPRLESVRGCRKCRFLQDAAAFCFVDNLENFDRNMVGRRGFSAKKARLVQILASGVPATGTIRPSMVGFVLKFPDFLNFTAAAAQNR